MAAKFLKWRFPGLVSAWLAALLIVAWLVAAGRHVALDRGERATAAFAAVVEQQVTRTFQTVYLTLGAIGDTHQIGSPPARHDPQFREMMKRRLLDLPFVRAVFVLGSDGRIVHDTDYPQTPDVSLADREYFRAYQEDPGRPATAWPPVLSRSGHGWFVPVTRALRPSGRFEGVVVAAIQAGHFEQQFRSARLPDGYVVSLFHVDGTLIASHPHGDGNVGRNFRHLPTFAHLAEAPAGSFSSSEGQVPGEQHVVSYRAVEGAPVVVRVSRSEDDLLAEWRRTATAAGLAMFALTAFLAWMVLRMVRASVRGARQREQRAQAEKMAALGQLSGGMAHDFANLFNVVGMNTALLRARPEDRQLAEHAITSIERAVQSGRQVSQRLLGFARRRPLALQRVRLDAWLEKARPLLAQAAGPGITVEVSSAAALPDIVCDASELDVALLNLVINARDAMAHTGRIEVRAVPCDEANGAPRELVAKPARFVCLTVKDEGCGMTEEVRRRALEPFYTTKGEAGTGLGLSQVYGFMQQLGGQVFLDSAPDRGTAVHLYFPVASASEP